MGYPWMTGAVWQDEHNATKLPANWVGGHVEVPGSEEPECGRPNACTNRAAALDLLKTGAKVRRQVGAPHAPALQVMRSRWTPPSS